MKAVVEQALYSRGSASILEDGIFQNLPIVGVCDGFSAPYVEPEHPMIMYGDKSGGQKVRDCIAAHINLRSGLSEALFAANKSIAAAHQKQGLSLEDASSLAGATFAFAEIKEECVEIIYTGDCYALWIYKSGKAEMTLNPFWQYEKSLRVIIKELMQKYHNRHDMWLEFYPTLCQSRKINSNKPEGYAVLNGQPAACKYFKSITLSISQLYALLLFTDGFVPFSLTENICLLTERIATQCPLGEKSLQNILNWTRYIQGLETTESHENFPEASAIAVRFI